MTDIEGFLAIYGHSDNLLNNNVLYTVLSLFNLPRRIRVFETCLSIRLKKVECTDGKFKRSVLAPTVGSSL